MDPQTTWELLAEGYSDNHDDESWEEIEEHARNLLDWLQKGGFAPDITGNAEFDRLVALRTCDAIIEWEVA